MTVPPPAAVPRGFVAAVCLSVGVTFTVVASLNYIITPVQQDLQMSSEQLQVAMTVPAIASVLVIFLVGRLGDRLGHRRVIVWASLPLVVGSAITAIAPNGSVFSFGLLLASGAATSIQIVGLGLLSMTVTDPKPRAAAFATFGMMFPAAYVVVPILSGLIVGLASWRFVPVMWMSCALVVPILGRRLLPPDRPPQPLGEVWTLLLAGIGVALAVQFLTNVENYGLLSSQALTYLSLSACSLVVCSLLYRRMSTPSLSLAPLRDGTALLMLVVIVIPLARCFIYITQMYQFVFGLSVLATAMVMIPAEVGAVAGSKLIAGPLMARLGLRRSGIILLALFAASMLLLVLIRVDSPLWLPVAIVTCLSTLGTASMTVVNARVMGTGPADQSANTAAFRGAASAIGSALAVVVLGTIVYTTYGGSLTHELEQQGLSSAEIAEVVPASDSWGASADGLYGETVDGVDVSAAEQQAMVQGIWANGIAGCAAVLMGLLLYATYGSKRRSDRSSPGPRRGSPDLPSPGSR